MADEALPYDELNEIQDVVERGRVQRLISEVQAQAQAVQPPPDFHARGMARIRRLPPPSQSLWSRGWRVLVTRPSAWSPALTAVLVISLASNIGLGLYALGTRTPSGSAAQAPSLTARQLLTDLDVHHNAEVFNAALFQAALADPSDLGSLVATQPTISASGHLAGFDASPRFYLIGTLYAEALAYVHSDRRDTAAQRLMTIARQLHLAPMPPALDSYLQKIQAWLQRKDRPTAALIEGLALFQPLCEAHARRQGERQLTLFRMGTWLVNMHLAAASDDRDLLKQAGKSAYFLQAMTEFEAQESVLEALKALQHVIDQPAFTDDDVQRVATLVAQLQQELI